MFRSLRFRLPALFLAGIALTGLVATAIAFGLFQDYMRDRAVKDLRREAAGISALYSKQAEKALDEDRPPPTFQARELERASGNRLFFVGSPVFLGGDSGLRVLRVREIGDERWRGLARGRTVQFEFTPPNEQRRSSWRSAIRSTPSRTRRRTARLWAQSSSPRRRPSFVTSSCRCWSAWRPRSPSAS